MKNTIQVLSATIVLAMMFKSAQGLPRVPQGDMSEKVRQCSRFPGAGAAQIAACLADVPAVGGYADSRGLNGPRTWESCPFDGITKPVTLELGVGTIVLGANCTVPANVHLVFDRGSIISIREGVTFNYSGGLTADDSPHFGGTGNLTFATTAIARYSPTWTGAACNGSGDDAAALNRLVAAMATGGTYSFPPGASCRVTSATVSFSKSNLVVEGNGAEILYEPVSTGKGNDRAILVHSGDSNLAKPVDITAAIGIGDTSFGAMSASGLAPGDWLFVFETDPGVKPREEIVIADWVQVAGVEGTTVKVYKPFRQVFPGTHSRTKFFKISNLVENVTIRDLRCRTSSAEMELPCFFVGVARNVILENTQASPRRGNPFASYRTSGLRIQGRATRAVGPSTEFASTTDLVVDSLVVISEGTSAQSASIVLDYGTAFFSVIAPQLVSPSYFGIGLWSGVYNGSILGGNVSYVKAENEPNSGCISMIGAQRVQISNNVCIGGVGSAAVGINIGNTSGYRVDIPSRDNVIANNIVSNFASPYGAIDCNNTYLIPNAGGPGNIRVPCKFQLGEAGTPQTLLNIKSNVQADLPIRWERPGGNTWYAGPDYSAPGRFTIAVDSEGAPVLQMDSSGFLYRKSVLAAALLAYSAVDGTEAYCSDCVVASTCAAGGTGALAKRLNGKWVCN